MSTWVAALVAAAAITLTYLFCVRPMMHGRGRVEDEEIAKLREELRALRSEQPHKQPPPP